MWIKCNQCGAAFSDNEEYKAHCIDKHPEFAARYKMTAIAGSGLLTVASVVPELPASEVPEDSVEVTAGDEKPRARKPRAKKGHGH